MRNSISKTLKLAMVAAVALPLASMAQREFYGKPSYFRPHDQKGINVFETSKTPDSIPYEGPRIRFGAGFTQQFQNLKHENTSNLPLYKMGPGFNLAMANLYTDIQLADGIRLDVTTYLSTRHHNETWVKGGYIQFDKLPFKGKFWSDLMELATVKVGHMEINYGDQHFRRTDAGGSIYNPFIENYIADAFSTEIGGEVYLQKDGLFGMIGVTNGTINSSIGKQAADYEKDSTKNPAIYVKAGIDKKLDNGLRLRFTGSLYNNSKSQRNVLYGGDRAGSHYWGVMEPTLVKNSTTGLMESVSLTTNAFSGRFNPGFTRNITAIMLNGFLKFEGFEVFGTYETAKGNAANALDPTKRKMDQIAVEGVYRFGVKEDVFIGARYNTVGAEIVGATANNFVNVDINRIEVSAGWFLTPNVLLKGEYVSQQYKNYPTNNILAGGKFNGYVIEAVVGF